jgi:hypothetical protein
MLGEIIIHDTFDEEEERSKNVSQENWRTETVTRGVVNGSLKFLSKLSTAVPKSTPKRHTNKCYENSSHQELRDPKDIPQITRNPTQKMELESETERARNRSQQHRLRAADSPL